MGVTTSFSAIVLSRGRENRSCVVLKWGRNITWLYYCFVIQQEKIHDSTERMTCHTQSQSVSATEHFFFLIYRGNTLKHSHRISERQREVLLLPIFSIVYSENKGLQRLIALYLCLGLVSQLHRLMLLWTGRHTQMVGCIPCL